MSSPEPTPDDTAQDTGVPSASPGYSTPPPEGVRDAEDQGAADGD
ncbi:hypothetical protein [Mycobacterium sp. PS03-16]|nr:hypothetical protein [Mycobacterium sp. PS03-16]